MLRLPKIDSGGFSSVLKWLRGRHPVKCLTAFLSAFENLALHCFPSSLIKSDCATLAPIDEQLLKQAVQLKTMGFLGRAAAPQ